MPGTRLLQSLAYRSPPLYRQSYWRMSWVSCRSSGMAPNELPFCLKTTFSFCWQPCSYRRMLQCCSKRRVWLDSQTWKLPLSAAWSPSKSRPFLVFWFCRRDQECIWIACSCCALFWRASCMRCWDWQWWPSHPHPCDFWNSPSLSARCTCTARQPFINSMHYNVLLSLAGWKISFAYHFFDSLSSRFLYTLPGSSNLSPWKTDGTYEKNDFFIVPLEIVPEKMFLSSVLTLPF